MGDDRPKAIPLYLSWVGTLSGALFLLLADVLRARLSFVRPDTLFVCLTEIELAFLLLAWPVFLPSLGTLSPLRLAGVGGLLLVAALPLALIAANVSNVGAAPFLRAQALLASWALLAAALFALARERGWGAGPWWMLVTFVLAAFLPFLGFVASTIAGRDFSWLSVLSPFWAGARADGGAALGQTAICGGLAGALLLARSLGRRKEVQA